MGKRFHILGTLLIVTLVLAACGGEGGAKGKEPPSASKSAADLRMIDQREVEIEGGRVLSLSPDGRWLAVDRRDVLCIYQSASLTEQSCALLPDRGRLSRGSVAWSPDSQSIAFTEDAVRLMVDSDIWLMEAQSGKLTNLTDDGVVGGFLTPQAGASESLLDVAPAWSPDSKQLAFARSIYRADAWQGTDLYRISAQGGDAPRLLEVNRDDPLVVWKGLSWSSDGKRNIYSVNHPKRDYPDNGIWMAEQDGENPQRLIGSGPELGPPLLINVAAKGDKALILYYQAFGQFMTEPNRSFFSILDLETGATEPLKHAKSDAMEFSGLSTAIFAPDGSKILYTYRDVGGQFRLAVRDVESETENVLLASDVLLGYQAEPGMGLNWAQDDTIFVATSPSGGLLVSLGTE